MSALPRPRPRLRLPRPGLFPPCVTKREETKRKENRNDIASNSPPEKSPEKKGIHHRTTPTSAARRGVANTRLARPATSQVHEQAGRLAAVARLGLGANKFVAGRVVAVVVVMAVLYLEHDFSVAPPPCVLPQHRLLPLGHPALDDDVARFLPTRRWVSGGVLRVLWLAQAA